MMSQEVRRTSPSSSDPKGIKGFPRSFLVQWSEQNASTTPSRRKRRPQASPSPAPAHDQQQGLHPALQREPPTRTGRPPQPHARRPPAPRAQHLPQPPSDLGAGVQISTATTSPRRITAGPMRPTVVAATNRSGRRGLDLPHTGPPEPIKLTAAGAPSHQRHHPDRGQIEAPLPPGPSPLSRYQPRARTAAALLEPRSSSLWRGAVDAVKSAPRDHRTHRPQIDAPPLAPPCRPRRSPAQAPEQRRSTIASCGPSRAPGTSAPPPPSSGAPRAFPPASSGGGEGREAWE